MGVLRRRPVRGGRSLAAPHRGRLALRLALIADQPLDDGQQPRVRRLVAGRDEATARRARADRAAPQVRDRAASRQADGDACREVHIRSKLGIGEVGGATTGGHPRQSQRRGGDARLEGRSELGVGEQRQRIEPWRRRPQVEVDVDEPRAAARRQWRLGGTACGRVRSPSAADKDLAGERIRDGGRRGASDATSATLTATPNPGGEVRRPAQRIDQPGPARQPSPGSMPTLLAHDVVRGPMSPEDLDDGVLGFDVHVGGEVQATLVEALDGHRRIGLARSPPLSRPPPARPRHHSPPTPAPGEPDAARCVRSRAGKGARRMAASSSSSPASQLCAQARPWRPGPPPGRQRKPDRRHYRGREPPRSRPEAAAAPAP